MKHKQKSYTITAEDADGICASQTPSGAGNLTINGALASGGTVTFTDHGFNLVVTAAADDSARTFTVTGTDPEGRTISEAIPGPNATTSTGSLFFSTITQIAVDAGTAGAITVGNSQVAATKMIPTNRYASLHSIGVNITGTVQYDVEALLQDPQNTTSDNQVWYTHSTLVNQSADASGNYIVPISAVRVKTDTTTGAPVIEISVLETVE